MDGFDSVASVFFAIAEADAAIVMKKIKDVLVAATFMFLGGWYQA